MYKIFAQQKYATTKKNEVLAAALESNDYCLQLKKDGSSYILAKDSDGSVHLYGSSISKKTGMIIDKIENVPHMKKFAEQYLPIESQLCIEVLHGQTSKDVNRIMLSLPPKAIARQEEEGYCAAYVYDILYWEGEELYSQDFEKRWNKVVEVIQTINDFTNGGLPWLSLAETYYDDKTIKLSEWLAAGEEGGVLKLLRSTGKISAAHAVSEIGSTAKRPMHTTYKIKQLDTTDVVIMGVEWPTSQYTGKDPELHPYKDEDGNAINRLFALNMINAFVIGAYKDGQLKQIGRVASGLNDELRLSAAERPEDYIGVTVEVECMSKDNINKTLRHPRMLKLREDKPAEQCLMEEIFS